MTRGKLSFWSMHKDYERIHDVYQQYDRNAEAGVNRFEGMDSDYVMDLLHDYETLIEVVFSSTDIVDTM